MALKSFKKIELKDREQTKLQENVNEFLNQLNVVFLDGVIVKDIALNAASTTMIPHGLSRAFQGWIVLDQDKGAMVWRDNTSTADSKSFLSLKASADVTVKLWVF